MVRNAGGRAFDAIRTLSVLQTIGRPGTIAIMHHTGLFPERRLTTATRITHFIDCGMTHFHDDAIKKALIEIAPEEKTNIESMKFGEIKDR
jgi:carbonic anhydrase